MSASLIQPDDIWTIFAVILLGVAASIYLEQNHPWAAKLSGPVLALVLALLLSNLKIMPMQSPAYKIVENYLVPAAIPLLLFRANLFRIIRTTGTVFVAVNVAILGTVVGAFLAAWMFRHAFSSVPEVAGIMTASYVGGAINFYAVKQSLHVSENLTGPLMVADNFIMAGMFVVLLGISNMRFFLRRYRHPHSQAADSEETQLQAARYWQRKEISLLDIAKALAIAVVIAAVSCRLGGYLKSVMQPSFVRELASNTYVLITFFSVLAATLFPRQLEQISGGNELGVYLLYFFFFVIGLPADLVAVVLNLPAMFLFCLVMAISNLAVTLALGRLLRLNLEELLLCSNATLGGPPTAAAMAISKGWSELVLPGLLAGLWGYITGTVVGVAVAKALMQLL